MEDILQSPNEQTLNELPEIIQESPEIQEQEVKVESKPKVDAQESFRQLREAKLKAERERDELLRQLQAQSQPQPQEEDEDFSIEPDALAEGKHLRKMQAKIKKLEQRLENANNTASQTAVEAKIKANYPDFDKIVSGENINALREQYPEIAATLHSTTDLYSKAVSAYTMIKKLGIAQEDLYVSDRQRAQLNAAKPRSLASVSPQQGESPLSRANAFANGLTEDLKTQLHKEMMEAMKNR